MPHRYHDIACDRLREAGINPSDENAVLQALDQDATDHWGVIVLIEIGTARAVEPLKRFLSHRNPDTAKYALEALAHILREEGRDLYLAKLEDPGFRDKLTAMRAIRDFDDGRAADAVVARMKRLLPRARNLPDDWDQMSEVDYAMQYLQRVSPEGYRTVAELVWKHWDRLVVWYGKWIKSRKDEFLVAPAKTLTWDELLKALQKAKFFEGFPPKAARLAKAHIEKRYEERLAGSDAKYYRRFPGFALVFMEVDGEWDADPFEPLVEAFAEASFGMFKPTQITDTRHDDSATLSFQVGTKRYTATDEVGGWIPTEFLELIWKAFKQNCGGMEFFETFHPGMGQSSSWTFCKPRAYRALVQAGLLPDSAETVNDINWDSV
jgi:hypothetical protein